ncbi:hypothetical protein [Streptacidiphilus albus]|uniref:hypothetical protein n=1 Tax=Streptacidiphilus albus TaxID=105425 RepID=UPI00054C0A29|nr:hypothetical protein [Streptacidiphilus albus]
MRFSTRFTRIATAGALAAGICLGTAGMASAAVPAVSSHQAVAHASISAHANRTSVGAWQQLVISGSTAHITAGTRLTLQQLHGRTWVSLPAVTTVTRSGAFTLRAELGLKGAEQLRLVGAGVVSNTLTVTVR